MTMPMSDGPVLKYLRELTHKIQALTDRVATLVAKVQTIGEQNFQIREVIRILAAETSDVRDDLSEYGGTLQEASWR